MILGGGFGGVSAARRFEQLLPWTPWLDVTLVSQRNYLLFTPMLAEVAAGLGRGRQRRGAAAGGLPAGPASAGARCSASTPTGGSSTCAAATPWRRLPYDQLVLAMGAVPNFRDLPGRGRQRPHPVHPRGRRGGCATTSSGGSSRPTTSPTRPSGAAGSPSSWPAAASPAPRPWPACSTWCTACSATSPTSAPASPASCWSTRATASCPSWATGWPATPAASWSAAGSSCASG